MTNVRIGGDPLYVGVRLEGDHTEHASVSVDQGAVKIDGSASDHVIRVKHVPNDGTDILAAIDRNTSIKTMHIDSGGKMYVPDVLYTANNESA